MLIIQINERETIFVNRDSKSQFLSPSNNLKSQCNSNQNIRLSDYMKIDKMILKHSREQGQQIIALSEDNLEEN